MSAEALPIAPEQFATALEALPIQNLYAKHLELLNSMNHLERSNFELEQFMSESGSDNDCVQAIEENKETIERMKHRIELVKAEVVKRNGRPLEIPSSDPGDQMVESDESRPENNSSLPADESDMNSREAQESRNGTARNEGRRLTDEQLREQLLSRLDDGDGEDGVHL